MDVFLLFSDEVLLNHSFHVQRKSRNIPAKDTSLGPWLQWHMQPLRKAKSLIGQCDFSQGTFLWVNQHFCVLDNFWKRLKILLNLLYITFSSQNVVVHDLAPVQPQFSFLPHILSKLPSSKLLAAMHRGHSSPALTSAYGVLYVTNPLFPWSLQWNIPHSMPSTIVSSVNLFFFFLS